MLKLTDVSEVRTASIIRASIALMMEAVRTSKTSMNFNVATERYIPEDSELQRTFCFLQPRQNNHTL
jgi:hypothetical protein